MFDAPWAIVYVAVIWLAHPALGAAACAAALLMLALAVINDLITRRDIEAVRQVVDRGHALSRGLACRTPRSPRRSA